MAPSMVSHFRGMRRDNLLQELRYLTGATDVCFVHTPIYLYAEQHILSATFTIGDTQLRYFYRVTVATGLWTRFSFEGSVADFFEWFKSDVPSLPHESWKRRVIFGPAKLPCDKEERYLRDARNIIEKRKMINDMPGLSDSGYAVLSSNAEAPTPHLGPKEPEKHLLDIPRELRDLCFDRLLSDTYVVHRVRSDGRLLYSSFATSCAIPNTCQQLRQEFHDCLTRYKEELPAIYIVAVEFGTDLSAILANSKQTDKICLGTDILVSPSRIGGLLQQIESCPQDHRPSITVVIRAILPELPGFAWGMHFLLAPLHSMPRSQVVFKQELVGSDRSSSGICAYKAMQPRGDTTRFIRHSDFSAYISLLLNFNQPSRGQGVLETLGWDMCCFAKISEKEQRLVEQALRPLDPDEVGLRIVQVGVGGGDESAPSKQEVGHIDAAED